MARSYDDFLNFGAAFNPLVDQPVDARLILSKAEMLEGRFLNSNGEPYINEATGEPINLTLPEHYICICVEDNCLYVYDSSAEVDIETGNFHKLSADSIAETPTRKFVTESEKEEIRQIYNHINNYNNPHRVTKDQVGLGNVDNTSDANKPISTATQNAFTETNNRVTTIEAKIPSAAAANNQLADKNYVNDAINSVSAYYITKNIAGDPFATKAELDSTSVFYSGGEIRIPTRNDFCIVQVDETKDNATTRYWYQNGWQFQYLVNETPLTIDQIAALNSGITAEKVNEIENKVDKISGKGLSTNDFTDTYKNQIDTNTQNITDLQNTIGYINSDLDEINGEII